MSTKTVYIPGKAHFLRPFFRDLGENLPEGSDHRKKIEEMEGQYNTEILLDQFSNRDDAEEYLSSMGVPTEGMMGNYLKRDKNTKEILYKIVRPHFAPNMPKERGSDEMGFTFGSPKIVDSDGNPWDQDIAIGNGSQCTFKLNVWQGTKVTRIRWDALRVDELVEYERPEGEGF